MSTSPATPLPSLSSTISAHFDPTKSSVKANPLNDQLKSLGFGRKLSDTELIALCGAPIKSKLELSYVPASTSGEITPEGVKVEIDNSTYFDHPMGLIFYIDTKGNRGVYIKLVVVGKSTPIAATSGLILESMLRANDAISKASDKFSEYRMLAAGGRSWANIGSSKQRWGGYAAWPRYGFNMPLSQETLDMFPHFPYVPPLGKSAIGTCNTVFELLALNKGRDFWDLVGDGWYMNFDTASGSKNRIALTSYLSEKYS